LIELEQKVPGTNRLDTFNAMHSLAQTLEMLKEDIEAEKWYRKAVEGMEQKFGSKHGDTLVMTYNLANLLFKTGQSKEARLLRNSTHLIPCICDRDAEYRYP
jgi:serine acetyltransferase